MRADAMQKRIEAMLADRTTGYAGVFKALLSAAVRRASGSAAAAADIALAPGFMAALSLAFDEAAQSGSVCVRFGAIEGALALFRIMSLEGGQLGRGAESAEAAQAAPAAQALEPDPIAGFSGSAEAILENLFEDGGLESLPQALRRQERATLEAGLEALHRLGLLDDLSEIERAAERLHEGSASAEPLHFAPFAADAARSGRIKAKAGFLGVVRKGRISDLDFEASRLYLAREALEEVTLARVLLDFALQPPKRLRAATLERIERLSASLGADALQRAAIELALKRRFAVISGGPGTGKTTTVVQILECLFAENPNLRVALAAPTGKAASRMRQSIMQGLASEKLAGELPHVAAVVDADSRREPAEQALRERTIHKWLLSRTADGRRPSPESPLEADVLIIDEASMVDMHLAARLFKAVSSETRIIVLGDKHQLAAVGPGAVFADISDESGALADCVVTLKTSRRFPEGTVISKLAKAINHEAGLRDRPASASSSAESAPSLFEDAQDDESAVFDEVKRLFDSEDPSGQGRYRIARRDDPYEPGSGLSQSAAAWIDDKIEHYLAALLPYLSAVRRNAAPEAAEAAWQALWRTLEGFRALAAQRHGPMSVDAVNARFEEKLLDRLRAEGWLDERTDSQYWPGRVLIVRRNDDMLGVFNGDIGIVLPQREPSGSFKYVVRFGDSGRVLPPSLLPPAQTAFAITIHQSQGSEFGDVAVFLPVNPASELATRELLYTGVTRTKGSVVVFGSEAALRRAVETPTRREGGLAERLLAGKRARKRLRKS